MTDLTLDDQHVYRYKGRIVPSVTQVLQPLTKLWTNGADLEKARAEGNGIHKLVELDCRNDLDETTVPVWLHPYLGAWRKFVGDTGFVMTHSEFQAYSETYGFAGTLDLAGTLTKVKLAPLAVIDIKRTLGAKTVPLQTAAYEKLVSARHPLTVKYRRFGLQLDPLRFVEYDDPRDWSTFLAALTIYRWREKNETHAGK